MHELIGTSIVDNVINDGVSHYGWAVEKWCRSTISDAFVSVDLKADAQDLLCSYYIENQCKPASNTKYFVKKNRDGIISLMRDRTGVLSTYRICANGRVTEVDLTSDQKKKIEGVLEKLAIYSSIEEL